MHTKRFSISLGFREVQIKTTKRYHYTLIKSLKVKLEKKNLHCQVPTMYSNYNAHTQMTGVQNGTATSEKSLAVSYKVKHSFTI